MTKRLTEQREQQNFSHHVERLIENENLQPKFIRFLHMAHEVSLQSQFETYKMGACICLKGRVIASACNSTKSHPKQKFYNQQRVNFNESATHGLHAEFAALNKLKGVDLRDAQMYISSTGADGQPRLCRPCAGCMRAIKDRGIKVIHYTTPEGVATEHLSKEVLTWVKKGRFLI